MTIGTDILSAAEKQNIRNVDRLLPSQTVMRKMFGGSDAEFHPALELLLSAVLPCKRVEDKWDLELKPGVTYASLGSDLSTLHLYQLLIALGNIRHVLELGTYIGVSALYLAEAVGSDGSITTVERGQEFHDIARRNFARNQVGSRVRALLGDAGDVLDRHATDGCRYDMVLVDAAKEDYAAMLDSALRCLAPGGLLVVDDIFMNGDTLNAAPVTDKGRGVKAMLAKVDALAPDYYRVVLPIGNGSLLIRKPT